MALKVLCMINREMVQREQSCAILSPWTCAMLQPATDSSSPVGVSVGQ